MQNECGTCESKLEFWKTNAELLDFTYWNQPFMIYKCSCSVLLSHYNTQLLLTQGRTEHLVKYKIRQTVRHYRSMAVEEAGTDTKSAQGTSADTEPSDIPERVDKETQVSCSWPSHILAWSSKGTLSAEIWGSEALPRYAECSSFVLASSTWKYTSRKTLQLTLLAILDWI